MVPDSQSMHQLVCLVPCPPMYSCIPVIEASPAWAWPRMS